ncbi:cation efflux family-domain-containing protein [Kalaharituber pfeilii]|nr:cation efflux family-domain-containing protein [Kalaharituber pfeilii]
MVDQNLSEFTPSGDRLLDTSQAQTLHLENIGDQDATGDPCAAPLEISLPQLSASQNAASFNDDPLSLREHLKGPAALKELHPDVKARKRVKEFYNRQNGLIDAFLNSKQEEERDAEDHAKNGGKVRLAVNLSSLANLCLFIIQLYAAIATGSLSLFATAADAFMDLVSSTVMLVTSRVAARPNILKYPVGRTRIETIGIILFCSLMSTLAVQLIVESARNLASGEGKDDHELEVMPLIFVGIAIGAKLCLFIYCFSLRRYPAARIFAIDHRNDIAVNGFGLIMSIVGSKYIWYLDPTGAILIALLILFSWASTAFEHVFLLVGKSAPQEFLNKLTYLALTHDVRILKIDTIRAYHAGQRYYVEVDIIMDEETPLRVSHDVSEALQRKLEGLADVERGFVHVDYEDTHYPHKEHKPVYEGREGGRTIKEMIFGRKKSA